MNDFVSLRVISWISFFIPINIGIIYRARGRIALAVTCDGMPEVNWTIDNPAYLLMSRL